MKILMLMLATVLLSNQSFAKSYTPVAKLRNGAVIVAEQADLNNSYINLKVEVDGRRYSICRYETEDASIEKLLCRNPNKSHSYVEANTLGMFKSNGVAISASRTAHVVECYNTVIIKDLSCASEAY